MVVVEGNEFKVRLWWPKHQHACSPRSLPCESDTRPDAVEIPVHLRPTLFDIQMKLVSDSHYIYLLFSFSSSTQAQIVFT